MPDDRAPLPLAATFERMKLSDPVPGVQEAMRHVAVRPRVLQEFRPLTEALEWRLSADHWAARGVLPFVEDDVPFVVNNSGRLSEDAAAVLFAACVERDPGPRLTVLELGAGTGLFARYFLDAFRAICAQEGRDWYDRLTYLVSDHSPRTVEHWQERGLFEGHAGRVVLGTCDAGRPESFKSADGASVDLRDLRAVFCNYVLDVLPSAVVRDGPGGCEQLQVRTHLTDDDALAALYTRRTLDELRTLAASEDPAARAELVPLTTLFELEVAFVACGAAPPPHAREALVFGKDLSRVLLNHGAIDCLEAALARLAPGGFVLVDDYGPVRPEQAAEHSATQRFGPTTALGINFPLLEQVFTGRGRTVVKPDGDDERPIHARLFAAADLPATASAFRNRFGGDAHRHFEGPREEARRHLAAGRKSEALECYRTALDRSPRDWHVVGEVAEFVALQLRDFAAGLELARAAVALNPWYSTWLWNVLGDCLFCLDRFGDAHEAYLQARRIHPDDARTNLNLAYTHAQAGAHREALEAVALGLARDARGVFRERLLEKQQQIIAALSARWLGEQERLGRRAARLA